MLMTFLVIQKNDVSSRVVIQKLNIDNFPERINDYTAVEDIIMQDSVIKELNTDVFVYREYENNKSQQIDLYIGYYGTKKGGRTGHNPYGCYPGGGWSIIEDSTVSLPVVIKGKRKEVTVNSLLVKKGGYNELVYFWYQSNGDKILSTGIEMNIHRFKSLLLYHRNDGAFVRVSTPVGTNLSETEQRIKTFVQQLIPMLDQYWPVEVET